MNTDIIIGMVVGASFTGVIASLLWIARDRMQGPLPIKEDWPEDKQ